MSLTHSIHRGKHLHGDRPALVFGERTTTYGELRAEVARCAAVFGSLAEPCKARVGILTVNCDRAIVSFYGAIWAGMVPNYLNNRWSLTELSASVDDFEPAIIVADDTFLDMALDIREACPSVTELVYIGQREDLPGDIHRYEALVPAAEPAPDRSGGADDMAFLNYTGGTTGKGKGVIHTHASHTAGMTMAIAEGLFTRGPTFLVTPLFHISGIGVSNSSLMMGNTIHIHPAFHPEKLLSDIQEHRIESGLLVPTMIQMLIHHPTFRDYDISSLNHVAYGASPIDQTLLMEARERLPGVAFVQVYGQTEGVPATLLFDLDHGDQGHSTGRTRSAGTPCYGVEIEIRGADGSALPRGEVGEICLRAPHVMQGYLNNPEQTAAALQGDWLVTGDAGYLSEDDYLYVVDRIKDMIISGGENVYCAEVESAICSHPAVEQCAVVGLPDEKWGELVHAEIVLKEGASASQGEIEAHCRDLIAGYKLPRSAGFVDTIPLTAVGKVDKVAIRERYS